MTAQEIYINMCRLYFGVYHPISFTAAVFFLYYLDTYICRTNVSLNYYNEIVYTQKSLECKIFS